MVPLFVHLRYDLVLRELMNPWVCDLVETRLTTCFMVLKKKVLEFICNRN